MEETASKQPKSRKNQKLIKSIEELTPQWAEFTQYYLESHNAYQSAVKAGFTDSYARQITKRFPDKVRNSLKIALEVKGITAEKIADKIDELLEAKTPIYKNNNETGEVELVGEKPDYQAIDKGISHAVKIRGDYTEEPEKPKQQNTYNFFFNPEVQAEVRAMEQKIKEMLVVKPNAQTP